ncbi:MAG: isoprenylcysteine carboxylmethyltransferase family protein [Bacteroidales bacterium]|nr:isoprenylcysteine carboxylmethyltransferase family protein [Bacteroidales bacterium]MBN2761947.1 isoprenylcysteine carboxylmethyltransferase family protein [Bacteroidales bacterium]
MFKVGAFIILSIPVIYISWRSLFNVRHHGFYRFLAWECILWLAVSNIRYWFDDPFSLTQIISWVCLVYCLYPVIAGFIEIKKTGKADTPRDNSLHAFEKTRDLVETGIFRYIRHPLYSSLLFLTWGILFKHVTFPLFVVALLSTGFLFTTALIEERENITYFGEKYSEYMGRTKMFVPWIV